MRWVALGVVVLVVAGVGAGSLLIDEAAIKARVSEAVHRATGRALALAGPLSIRPGLSLAVAADDVSFANAPGGSRPEMASVRRVEARVAWLPLFSREVVLERLTLVGPSVLLETNADGVPNWRFEQARAVGPGGAAGSPGRPWGVDARLVELRDGVVEWHDGRTGRAARMPVPRLAIEAASAEAPISLAGDVGMGGLPAHVSGQLGSASAFRSAASPWPVRVVAESTTARLAVSGDFARPRDARGYDLALEGAAGDLSALSGLAGFALPAFKNVTLAARVADTGGGLPDVSGVAVHAGGGDFTLDGFGALRVDHLDFAAPRMDAPMELRLDGGLAGTAARLSAALGTPASLLAGGAPFPIDVRAEAAGASLRVNGGIAQVASFTGLDVAVTAGIPDLAALSPLAGRRLPGFTGLAFTARMTDGDGGFRGGMALRDIGATAPQGDLSGNMAWRFAGRPRLDAELSSKRLDLDAIRAILAAQPPVAPASPSGVPKIESSGPARAIPDTALPFAALNRGDGDVRLAVGELRLAGLTLAGVAGRAALRDGRLVVDPFGGQGGGGRIDMTASVAEPAVALFLRGDGIAVKPVLAAFGWPDDVTGNADLSLDLRGQGRTLRALAAGLDGHVALAVADGEIDNSMLAAAFGGFLRAARLPIEFGVGRTGVRCLAVRLDAARGVVGATTMLLDTTRLMLQGTGEVNLADERMALRFRPLLRIGGPGLVVPVRLGGTLREPKVALDSGGLLGALMAGERRNADACAPALASARLP